MAETIRFRCHGCGAEVPMAFQAPFRCPAAIEGDDLDHVLIAVGPSDPGQQQPGQRSGLPAGVEAFRELAGILRASARGEARSAVLPGEQDPFLRYRALLSPYRLARSAGLSDGAWAELEGALDRAIAAVDGKGFRLTPMAAQPALAAAAGLPGELWVKDETGNVSGSHKARHLMGVLLYLRVLEAARLSAGEALQGRRLAIASCGNAALAAAVLARAAGRPLDVFIPPDAEPPVVARLRDLGAAVEVCTRAPGQAGDPCMARFRAAVAAGAIPFGVQGNENGLAVEGGWTLALELAEQLAAAAAPPDHLYVQVGGGAMASALAQGLALAVPAGLLPRMPRLVAVQTEGCAPLVRAWARLEGVTLGDAARERSRFMWPWEEAPHSLAHGILDDETYDWWAVAQGLRASGGGAAVVDEGEVARARELGAAHTAIRATATGTAGLAGCLAAPPPAGRTAVIFSGGERSGPGLGNG